MEIVFISAAPERSWTGCQNIPVENTRANLMNIFILKTKKGLIEFVQMGATSSSA